MGAVDKIVKDLCGALEVPWDAMNDEERAEVRAKWDRFVDEEVDGHGLPGTPRKLRDSRLRRLAKIRPGDLVPVLREKLGLAGRYNRITLREEVTTDDLLLTIGQLAGEVLRLRAELRRAYGSNAEKNRTLDALMWGWCGGGCEYGAHTLPHRLPLTAEVVELVERSAAKLRRRWEYLTKHRLGLSRVCEKCGSLVAGPNHDCPEVR